MSDRCYIDRDNGVRFTRNKHRHDCTDTDCRGCTPCPELDHCTGRGCSWHIEQGELTCGRCIGTTRRHLAWIGLLAPLMPAAAVESGSVNSEAVNLAGPAPDPRDWTERHVAMSRHLSTWESLGRITERQALNALANMPDDDDLHPYAWATRWQMMVAEDYGDTLPAKLTTAGALDYLDTRLHRIANDEGQDFGLLSKEARRLCQHLQATLASIERPERGAPCYRCRDAGVEKPPRLVREYGHHCDDEDCQKLHYSTRYDADLEADVPDTTGDRWTCPRDRDHWWSERDYRGWVEERVKAG